MKIVESEFITSAVEKRQYPESPFLEIAFAGKSNVGKSSLINVLLNRKKIAKTSSTPGKTRLINFFKVRVIRYNEQQERIGEGFFSLVDLPGYGYAKVSKTEREKWKAMIKTYLESRPELRLLLLLVDIRHSADHKDKLMIEMLEAYQLPYIIIATKADKVPKTTINKYLKGLSREFGKDRGEFLAVSVLNKTGIKEMLEKLEETLF
ncbi:MAG: ribosome biogenesis GTP-binding protein YihA/YsxC [Candidatus Cloacimonetes bacterium]|nr:ribosome biogenesis GTP-binding protein YihA/YsxC [Candidatus Cloacimonadota bacterium]